MKYPAKNPATFLKPEPEPEPDIEAGYPAGSGFSRISGRFLYGIFGNSFAKFELFHSRIEFLEIDVLIQNIV